MGKPVPAKSTRISPALLVLFLALLLVVACRLLLYAWLPGQSSDFDLLYRAAASLVRGESAYPTAAQSFPYPLPAVLLAVPFSFLPLTLARPLFDVPGGLGIRVRPLEAPRAQRTARVDLGAYLFAMASSQTTPLMVAAILLPALGFLLAVRPNISAALWIARPSWLAVLRRHPFLRPEPGDSAVLASRVVDGPAGRQLLFSRRRSCGQWASSCYSQPSNGARRRLGSCWVWRSSPRQPCPYELVALALIPANRLEMAVYVVGSWMAVIASNHMPAGRMGIDRLADLALHGVCADAVLGAATAGKE